MKLNITSHKFYADLTDNILKKLGVAKERFCEFIIKKIHTLQSVSSTLVISMAYVERKINAILKVTCIERYFHSEPFFP